jgi:hypothetical protein
MAQRNLPVVLLGGRFPTFKNTLLKDGVVLGE